MSVLSPSTVDNPSHPGSPPSWRVLMTTYGSFGDLHPYLAIGRELLRRGHRPMIATFGMYRSKVEAEGIAFHAVRPEVPDGEAMQREIARVMNQHNGSEYVIRHLFMSQLRPMYEDLLKIAGEADVIVGHPLTFSARMVTERLGIPWVSSVLAPLSFFSIHDPPLLPRMLFLGKLRFLGPAFHRRLFRFFRWMLRKWSEPWHDFRAELGLPRAPDPIWEGQHSPDLVLALFSPTFGPPQHDWPANTVATGFALYDRDGEDDLDPRLQSFLDQGPPPVVFTLGSSAVHNPGAFWEESIKAAKDLGIRAVLLVGRNEATYPRASLPAEMLLVPYAPFSQLFPRASAIVHQGGAGTTGQALRSGRPMLVVPHAHDQPDNAIRTERLGVGRMLLHSSYRAHRVRRELGRLLNEPRFAQQAATVGASVRNEDGAARACEALEAYLAKKGGLGPLTLTVADRKDRQGAS